MIPIRSLVSRRRGIVMTAVSIALVAAFVVMAVSSELAASHQRSTAWALTLTILPPVEAAVIAIWIGVLALVGNRALLLRTTTALLASACALLLIVLLVYGAGLAVV